MAIIWTINANEFDKEVKNDITFYTLRNTKHRIYKRDEYMKTQKITMLFDNDVCVDFIRMDDNTFHGPNNQIIKI